MRKLSAGVLFLLGLACGGPILIFGGMLVIYAVNECGGLPPPGQGSLPGIIGGAAACSASSGHWVSIILGVVIAVVGICVIGGFWNAATKVRNKQPG